MKRKKSTFPFLFHDFLLSSRWQLYQTLFDIKLGHCIICTIVFMCYKLSSLRAKVGKQVKTKFCRLDSSSLHLIYGKKTMTIASFLVVGWRAFNISIRFCILLCRMNNVFKNSWQIIKMKNNKRKCIWLEFDIKLKDNQFFHQL